jgi:heterodisulfide reductase subunit B
MKIAYYPGCTLKSNAKNFEDSALASMKVFGIEMEEIPKWNCCGTVFSLASDDLIHHLAPIRILLRTKEQGYTSLITLCSMCYHTLKMSNLRIKDNKEELEKINTVMYKENIDYDGSVSVHHLLSFLKEEIGFEEITKKVTVDLKNLNIAPYYGCLLLRPEEISIDPSMENPIIFSEFISALGAHPVMYSHQTECCGAYLTVNEKDLVIERSYEILAVARKAGADMLITSCPLCQFNLDDRQNEIKKKYPQFEEIPVLYFTQLLALALGLDEKYVRFDLNWVKPEAILKEKNVSSKEMAIA